MPTLLPPVTLPRAVLPVMADDPVPAASPTRPPVSPPPLTVDVTAVEAFTMLPALLKLPTRPPVKAPLPLPPCTGPLAVATPGVPVSEPLLV